MSADTSTTMATPSPSPLSADGEKNVAVPAETFTLFPKLATELRLKVWKMVLPGPRVVVVEYSKKTKLPFSPARIPVILQVNRESRDEALKSYTLAFGLDGADGKIFFDFSNDIFVFDEDFASQTKVDRCRDLDQVQHLAIPRLFLYSIRDTRSKVSFERKRNRSLKQLYAFEEADSNIHQTRQDVTYEVQDVEDENSHTRFWIRKLEKAIGFEVKLVLFRGMRGPSVIVDDENEGGSSDDESE
jgi:hypothetical protein